MRIQDERSIGHFSIATPLIMVRRVPPRVLLTQLGLLTTMLSYPRKRVP